VARFTAAHRFQLINSSIIAPKCIGASCPVGLVCKRHPSYHDFSSSKPPAPPILPLITVIVRLFVCVFDCSSITVGTFIPFRRAFFTSTRSRESTRRQPFRSPSPYFNSDRCKDRTYCRFGGSSLSTCHKSGFASRCSPCRKGVGKLLGPAGGIEKWGWSLLAVLELVEPPVVVTHHSTAQLALEADTQLQHRIDFPGLFFRNLSTHEAKNALVNMFHALGAASGEAGLYAVGWFFRIGYSAISSDSVAALWCACRLLEGIGSVSLSEMRQRIPSNQTPRKRMQTPNQEYCRDLGPTGSITEKARQKSRELRSNCSSPASKRSRSTTRNTKNHPSNKAKSKGLQSPAKRSSGALFTTSCHFRRHLPRTF
jgi:hypothetical protein